MPGSPASLTLTPSDSSGPEGSTLQFTVTVEDELGNPVNGVVVSLRVCPERSCWIA
jgi:hypothetical protein